MSALSRVNFLGRLESLALLAMGAWCVSLLSDGDFWLFLHPRFQWLLAASAFCCVFMGMLLLVFPMARPHWRGVGCLLLTIVLGMVGQQGLQPKADSLEGDEVTQGEAAIPEFYEHDGHQYRPINLSEMYLQTQNDAPPGPGERFAMQGMWLPDPQGLAPGVLLRLQFTCCLADSIGVGMRVDDANAPEPQGQWVRVLGRVEKASPEMNAKASSTTPQFDNVFMSVVNSDYLFIAEHIEPIEPPKIPFMFEMRGAPPYAY